jgi:hypothetical protein
LRYLDQRGGRAPSREVVEAIGETLGSKLTALDRQSLMSGDIRWESGQRSYVFDWSNEVSFERGRQEELGSQ